VQSIASNIDNAVEDVNIYLSKVKNKKNRKQLKKIQENLSQKKAELIHQSNTLIKNDKTNFTLLNNITNFVGNRNNMIKEIVQQDSIESQKDKKIYINGKAYTKKDIAYHSMKSFGRGIKTLGRYTGIFLLIMMEGVKEQSRDYRAVVANSMNVMGTSIGTSNIMQTASIPNIISPNTTFSLPFSSMPMMPINLPSQNMTARSIDTSPLTMMLLDNLTRPPRPQKRNNFFPAQQQFMPPPPRMTGHNFSQPAAFNKRTIQGTHSIEQSKIDTSDIKELQKLLDKNAEILQNRIQEIDKRKAEEKKNKQGTVQPSLENEKIKTKISEENKQQNNNVSQVIQKNKEEETLLSPHFERGVDNMLKQIRIDFVRDDLKEAVKNVMQSQKMFSTFRYDTGKEDYITKLADIFIETGKAKNLENYILGKIEGKVERKTHFSPDKILTFMNSAQEELANKIAEGLNKHLDVCVKLVEKTDLKTAKSVALIDVVEAIRRSRNLSVREESARNYKLEQLINSLGR
jgi:uncharacterized protein YfkK (UPF0435 family)